MALTASGAWMLVDRLRHPATADPDQLWMALAVVVMFGACGLLFGFEIVAAARKRRPSDSHRQGTSEAPLVMAYSNVWMGIALAGCAAFAAAGLFMLKASLAGGALGEFVVGLLAAVVFGGFAVIGGARLWQSGWSGGRVSIEAAGIRDSRLGGRLIAWDEIAVVTCRTFYGQRLVEVRFRDPQAFAASLAGLQRLLARLNGTFGFASYAITLTGLSVSEQELVAAIVRLKPASVTLLRL